MRQCIVTYARNGRENYLSGIPRLIESAQRYGYTGDWLIIAPGGPLSYGAIPNHLELTWELPEHFQVPYAFKPEIVRLAEERNHELVLWCDSTVVFNRDAQLAFDKVRENGLLVAENPGIPVPWWTADAVLERLGWEAGDIRTQCMACALGFDFTNVRVRAVFDHWLGISRDGVSFAGRGRSVRPEFQAHRHDQSVISILAHQAGFPMVPYGFLSYWGDRAKFDAVLCNQGLRQR